MRIIVLAGGLSTERDVSLSSGAGICRTLREKGHDAFLLDPFLGLPDAGDNLEAAFTRPDAGLSLASGIRSTEPDLEAVKASREDKSDCFFGANVIELCRLADIVFMGLHGDVGENGKLQAAFDVLGIRYTGSGSLGCALSMDKEITKVIFEANPDYYGEEPRMKKVTVLFMEEDAAFAAALAGQADVVYTAASYTDQEVTGYHLLACESVDNRGFNLPAVPRYTDENGIERAMISQPT